jgi:uncharacterized protein
MSYETLEVLVRQAIDYADEYLTFAFQGGEPTLAGVEFFEKAVELQQKYNTKGLIIENTLQTNGILLDESWAAFLHKNHFLVGLSLDGPKKVHDLYRKNVNGSDTFSQVMNAARLLDRYQVDYNIVSVITNDSCDKASYLYKFYKRNKFPYVQFIPCMDERKRKTEKNVNPDNMEFALNPEKYGRFLNELFDVWYEDFIKGEIIDIRMFSNLAQMAAGYPAEECGMNGCCNCYFVVEGNGDVYPCDFYCMDKWKLGTVEQGFKELYTSEKAKDFVRSSEAVEDKCKNCKFFSLCHGGCRRWREEGNNGKAGLNYLCRSYEIFFEHCSERIKILGQYIRLS